MKGETNTNHNYFKYYGMTTVFFLWDKDTNKYFKGVAVCRDGEAKYKKEFGEALARAKAVYKMRQYKAADLQNFLTEIEEGKAIEAEVRKQLQYFTEKSQESFELIEQLHKEAIANNDEA